MAYLGRPGATAPLTSADIPDNSITAAKIVADTIAAGDLAPNSVDSSELVDGGVDLSHMSANSVDSDQYVDGSIDTAHIGDDQVTGDKLANNIAISTSGAITTTGAFTSVGIDDNASGATAITIDSNENVGIGQTSPASDNSLATFLHIGNSSSANSGLIIEDNQNQWEIYSDEGLVIADGTTNRIVVFSGGEIRLTNPAGGSSLDFWTGNRFGPTSNNGLDLGNSTYRWSQIHVGQVNEYSDRQGKNTITDCELGENFLNQLQARKFKFNDGGTDHHAGVRLHYGLIAQEVEDILESNNIELDDFAPVCKERIVDKNGVEPDEDDYIETLSYSLRYSQFIAPLIKAVQELSAKVTALENA